MAVETCYKGPDFAKRIRQKLGVELGEVECRIVDDEGMRQAMSSAGWGRNEMDGVIGFQIGKRIYVQRDSTWTTLHELIHRSGINADRVNRYVAEGLTEAVAEQLRTSPDEHKPTYPQETTWVKQVLLPKLGMTALELGSFIAKASEPHRDLAELLLKKDPKLNKSTLIDELKPQRPNPPQLGSANRSPRGVRTVLGEHGLRPLSISVGREARPQEILKPASKGLLERLHTPTGSSGRAASVGFGLMVIGAVLAAPVVISDVLRRASK